MGDLHPLTDWIEHCFTSPPTQYRLYGRRFLQVKRPNQQYHSTEGTNSTQTNQTHNNETWTQNTASPLVYNNMGWLGDSSHRGQGCHAWTAVGLPPRYPLHPLTETSLLNMYDLFWADINTRLAKAAAVFRRLDNVWRSSTLSLKIKLDLYTSLIISTAIYASETWKSTAKIRQQLEVFHQRNLRKILALRGRIAWWIWRC